jgi:hypothetical protein
LIAMTSQRFICSAIACAVLLGVALLAQDNPPPTQTAELELATLPPPNGIYYRASRGWVALSPMVLMPFAEGKAPALEILNVGSDHTVVEMPGSHAGVQIGNDARPIFYLHGISPSDLYLVRAVSKADYREVRMPVSRHFREWAHFRAKDVADVEIVDVNGDVVAIRPRVDLTPGEYTLASLAGQDYRWLRLGFDFGILGRLPGQ